MHTNGRDNNGLFAMSEAMRAFAESSSDFQRLVEVVAERAGVLLSDGCMVALASPDNSTIHPVSVWFRDPADMRMASDILELRPVSLSGPSVGPQVFRSSKGLLLSQLKPERLKDFDPQYATFVKRLGIRSLIVVPLTIRDEVSGILSLARKRSDAPPFNEADQALATNLAEHAAVAIHNAQLLQSLQKELEERKKAEDLAERFYALIQHSNEMIAMARLDGSIMFVNDCGKAMLGLEPNADVSTLKLADFHTDQGIRRADIIKTKGRWQGEGQLRHQKTGELIDTQVNSFLLRDTEGNPLGFATVQRDIRDTKRLEAHLRQIQRMEAVGRLAGGVAHDFNNLLSIILSYSSILLERALDEQAQSDLDQIHTAGKRAAALTQQLLAFSRQQVLEPRIVNLNDIIFNVEKMIRRLIGEDVLLRVKPEPDLCRVKVDVGQIEQVVMNLVINARDAMPNGGHLTIQTANVEVPISGISPPRTEATRHVLLAVTDTGSGIDQAMQQKIFEPFFTTKAPGKGTGLGLSTVLGIVEQSGGTVVVTSQPGQGTCFEIRLPVCDDLPIASEFERRAPKSAGGTEAILLVEDEAQVRSLMQGVLSRAGYRVTVAPDAATALALCTVPMRPFQLLLTDVVMPKMNGYELAEAVKLRSPNTRVLYVSGYSDEVIAHHGVLNPGVMLLEKPFTPESLRRRVREVLDLETAPNTS